MNNEKICPETELRVLLPAGEIPDGARVSKRTGDEVYVIKHNIRVYPADSERESQKPIELTGFFLVGSRGSINQVEGDKLLHWVVDAEEFIDTIKLSWEPDQ